MAQVKKVQLLGVAKAEKWNGGGGFYAAHNHTVIREYPPPRSVCQLCVNQCLYHLGLREIGRRP